MIHNKYLMLVITNNLNLEHKFKAKGIQSEAMGMDVNEPE